VHFGNDDTDAKVLHVGEGNRKLISKLGDALYVISSEKKREGTTTVEYE